MTVARHTKYCTDSLPVLHLCCTAIMCSLVVEFSIRCIPSYGMFEKFCLAEVPTDILYCRCGASKDFVRQRQLRQAVNYTIRESELEEG